MLLGYILTIKLRSTCKDASTKREQGLLNIVEVLVNIPEYLLNRERSMQEDVFVKYCTSRPSSPICLVDIWKGSLKVATDRTEPL